jgi:hypothetical protein
VSLLNLTLPEVIALFSTLSAVLVTLYLLDRTRRKQVVATLRFWNPAENATSMRQKRRIQQPWSLLLQLLSIALLLLAISQMQWGERNERVRDHILVLDTSAWMGARTGDTTLMDEARRAAIAYVRRIPASDRIMVVRADALATPATSLDTNRGVIEQAIRESKPSSAALNLGQAFEFSARVQKLHGGGLGDITYVGAGRVPVTDRDVTLPGNLRVIPVKPSPENVGIRKIGLRRSDADTWQIFVSVKNYSAQPRASQIAMQFGGAPLGNRTLPLAANSEQQATFSVRTRAAGWLEARLLNSDAYPEDDRAVLELPGQRTLNVAIYTDDPDALRPIVAASPNVTATFRAPSSYDPKAKADVVVFDAFAPASAPEAPSIWIDPPQQRSPIRIKSAATAVKLASWNGQHDLGMGLRTRDVELEKTSVFIASQDDISVASVEAGPVIVARPQSGTSPKLVVMGFHPARSAMRYELATPLLFANILRWVDAAVFQQWEFNAGTVGTVEVALGKDVQPESVKVVSDATDSVPYTIHQGQLRFFAGTPGAYRIRAGDREMVYSLTLPEVGEGVWEPPAGVRIGLPRATAAASPMVDLWPWLALLGTAGLVVDWIYFGRGRREARVLRKPAQPRVKVLQKKAS